MSIPLPGQDPKRTQFVDSTLNANKHIEWVKDLYNMYAPSIQVPGQQYRSTHLMGDNGQGYVFPHITHVNGQLNYIEDEDEAENYARKTNTGIQFKTPQDGSWFAANGYKNGTNVLKNR